MTIGFDTELNSDLSPLFEPLTIRGMTIANRFTMAPMTRSFCPDNLPGDDVVDYYARRADGGTGLLITEAIGTDHPSAIGDTGLGEMNLPLFSGAETVSAWSRVADAVHAHGGHIIPQLWHQGPMRMPDGVNPAFSPSGRYGDPSKAADYYVEKAKIISASPMPVPSDEDIADVIASFGRAARDAVTAGFDGLALHGAHGYLIDSFLWAETNHRPAPWGGDAVTRTRFAVEVVKACRAELGEDRPLIFRFSQWKQQDFRARLASTPAELEAILGPIADAGVDLFDASVRYFNTPAFPQESELSLAGWAKKVTGKLSGAVGGIGIVKGMYDTVSAAAEASNNLGLLLKRFENGEFDIASVGRMILHDPQWVANVRRGEPLPPFDPDSLTRLT
ncbi:oxidoreductase [Novosphingobium taihuense]|uniref:2,4-dienoyl-CoA reductase-like NADH-dependent reductase (Old Yellow Enzyme family) n=1 Tax=Novosphingobium taihuense TaxID=260085 RepID=A0A7W7EWF8_9SPHN|nr:12-oxophytodienoate reductase [Novosphingobium taihuense]MBB4614240.1 2,4-dienoyl-CoA reductase-like NADH-dependent reductase (Old Yellow Enzyme family) [Novosphingobium taihuense]TWH87087.1 2,4-dienoyl-CoA reductase-like NADH-dependent reductase (Old Yellow Enzyme family) [Novosphingobium taihuense]